MADGGALTTDGTYIYAFQGKTTAFWRYNIAANTWTVLAPFSAATNQGGALVFVPGLNPQGRFTLADRLPLAGRHRRRGHGHARGSTSSTAVNNVVAGSPDRDADGRRVVQHPDRPDARRAPTTTTPSIDDPVIYEWTCTVAAGATPGSLTFSDSRRPAAARSTFPPATSNSVLVSPPLTFTRDGARRRPEPDRRPGPDGGERPDRRARRRSRRSSARRS